MVNLSRGCECDPILAPPPPAPRCKIKWPRWLNSASVGSLLGLFPCCCFIRFWFWFSCAVLYSFSCSVLAVLFCFGCFSSVCFCVISHFLFHCLTIGFLGYITPVLLFGLVLLQFSSFSYYYCNKRNS